MIIDASIIVAMALREPALSWIVRTLDALPDEPLRMPWTNVAECGMTLNKRKSLTFAMLERLLTRIGIEPIISDYNVIHIAVEARRSFPLRFGDCFAYAHARYLDEPLMSLDGEFLKTDLRHVLHPATVP